MNIALIGPSGAGKGTHVDYLEQQFGLIHVSTGELFRRNLRDATALGLVARKYMDAGELVPDEITEAMMEEWLRRTERGKGILFDGFPRTEYQARFLDDLFGAMGDSLDALIYLEVDDDVVVERLAGRVICGNCEATYHLTFSPPASEGRCDRCGSALYHRPDDTPELIRTRLKVFHRATAPLLDYVGGSGRLVVIDGAGDTDSVRANLSGAMDSIVRGEVPAAAAGDIERIRAGAVSAPAAAVPARLDIVLLGGPGSGKGTQAEQLSKTLDVPHIATGDLFRENLRNETELGKLAKTFMNRGELVPDDVTEAMVEERLARPDAERGFILDGFPRTVPQAEALTEMLTDAGRRLAGVIYIMVSDDEIVNRLSGRLICRACQSPFHTQFKPPAKAGTCDHCAGELYQRDDDNPDTIRQRLKTFHGQTAPLADYYASAGLLHEVVGEGPLDEVSQRTLTVAESVAAA